MKCSHGRENFTHYQGTVRSIIWRRLAFESRYEWKINNPSRLTKWMVFIRKMSVLKASVKALRGLTQLGQLRSGLGYTLLEHHFQNEAASGAVGMWGDSHCLNRNWATRQSCTYWPSLCESAWAAVLERWDQGMSPMLTCWLDNMWQVMWH